MLPACSTSWSLHYPKGMQNDEVLRVAAARDFPRRSGGDRSGCSAGDASGVVMLGSEEYVVTCSSVREDARSEPQQVEYRPAGGGDSVNVTAHKLDGLSEDEIVAVTGPADVLCADASNPGSGVAFSSKMGIETVNQEIEPLLINGS